MRNTLKEQYAYKLTYNRDTVRNLKFYQSRRGRHDKSVKKTKESSEK